MQSFEIENGLTYTAACEASVTRFADIVAAYLGFSRESGPLLKALLTEDPDMPMAKCMMGYFQKLFANAKMSQRARHTYAELKPLLETNRINEREKLHISALGAWSEGDLIRTAELWERILVEYPLDSLAVRMAHYLHFYSGDGRRMRDSIVRVLPNWSESDAHYGFVLGMAAFGHEECAEYRLAEKYAREGCERNPLDIWAVHAAAHVFEMQERHQEGIEWVQSREPSWSQANNFRFHVAWHRCLYHLELNQVDEILAIYDRDLISDLGSGFNLDLCNATSLLWRLEMHGVAVGDRWERLAEISREHIDDRDLVFVSLHYLMALISAGDEKAAGEMIETMRAWSQDASTQGVVAEKCGLAMAEAMRDIRSLDYEAGAQKLRRVRYLVDDIGGSKAQRDVFQMLMLHATRRSGDNRLAQALYAERTAARVHSAWGWENYADVLGENGLDENASQARLAASRTTPA